MPLVGRHHRRLFHKLKTGKGIYFATGESSGPTGSAHLFTARYEAFRASDGWISIGGANQGNWEHIAVALGQSITLTGWNAATLETHSDLQVHR
jgi:crotonobetainyl-CoA:carnitine CoA-transferase CaiB-like acyl-CoA transferase